MFTPACSRSAFTEAYRLSSPSRWGVKNTRSTYLRSVPRSLGSSGLGLGKRKKKKVEGGERGRSDKDNQRGSWQKYRRHILVLMSLRFTRICVWVRLLRSLEKEKKTKPAKSPKTNRDQERDVEPLRLSWKNSSDSRRRILNISPTITLMSLKFGLFADISLFRSGHSF